MRQILFSFLFFSSLCFVNAQDETLPLLSVNETDQGDYYNSITFSPDGKFLASVTSSGYLKLWNADNGSVKFVVQPHANDAYALEFSSDGKLIATGGWDNKVYILDAENGKVVYEFEQPDYVDEVMFLNGGNLLLIGNSKNEFQVWDYKQRKMVKSISDPSGNVWAADQHRKTGMIAVSFDSKVMLLDKKFKQKKILSDQRTVIYDVCFSPDGKYVFAAGEDDFIAQWDVKSGKLIRKFQGHSSWVGGISLSPDGKYLVSACADRTLITWEVATGKQLHVITGESETIFRDCKFSPDGKTLAAVISSGIINVYRLEDITR